jgi:putative effector of murein hydrolase
MSVTLLTMDVYFTSILLCIGTVAVYVLFTKIQQWLGALWCHPMIMTIFTLIVLLLSINIEYQSYQQATKGLSWLIEPAVVAFGYPLYQQLSAIKSHWKKVVFLLLIANVLVIVISLVLVMLVVGLSKIAISLSLKSITTAIAITLSQQLNGDISITAFAVILAGLLGAFFGIPWLNFIHVTSPKAQGLAIGAASHALGTATVSQLSYQHGAFASLALIISAIISVLIAPILITHCLNLL